jgi:AraC family transcriptional regulator
MRFAPTQFPAPVVRSERLGDFVVSETRYGAGEELPLHSHEYGCLVIVLAGTFRERSDGRSRHGAPGTIIVRPQGEPHSNCFDERGGRCLNVEIAPHWLACMREGTGAFETPAALAGAAFSPAGSRLSEGLTRLPDESALALESLLLAFAAERAAGERLARGAPPRWLLGVRDQLHADAASRLRLADLAAEAGVHPVHLASTFRRFFGITLAQYVRRLRVDYACRAIAGSASPLAQIALDAGFADQSHLGRAFKRATGMTPAAYRGLAGAA